MFLPSVAVTSLSPVLTVNVFAQNGQDPRTPASSSPLARQLAAVGRIVTTRLVRVSKDKTAPLEHASSTGFLVSPCYVLTTAHGVFGVPEQGFDPARSGPTNVTFITGQSMGSGLTQSLGQVVAQGEPFRIFEQDWALVRLARCEGRRLGWLSVSVGATAPFSSVSMAGFPGDRDEKTLWYQANCHVMRFDLRHFIWETDCATSPGSSGAPIFQIGSKSSLQVIAMVVMEERRTSGIIQEYSSEKANYALDLRFVLPKIKKLVEKDIAINKM